MTWLTNWNRRKLITVNGSIAGNQSDYQMKLTVNQTSGTDAPGIIYCSGNINSDLSDLRFTDSGGSTELSYWIESITGTSPTQSATVWVRIGSIPTTGTTIYVYYNNSNTTTTTSTKIPTFIRVIGSDVSQPVKGAWRFDETSGNAADYSGNSNTGVLVNSPTRVTGKFGNALNFVTANSQYVNTGASSTTDVASGNANFTYAVWINAASDAGWSIILARGIQSGQIYYPYVSITYNNGIISFNMIGSSPNGSGYCDATTSIKDNNWHYVVGVRNGSATYVYIDGSLSASLSITSRTYGYASEPLYIGAQHFNSPGDRLDIYCNVKIDEPRIYNTALTQAEITDLYNNYGYVTTNYPGRELVRKYVSPEPTFSTTGTEELGITATTMTISKSETPCRTGICTITATVTWQNLGSSSITFRPKIIMDGTTYVSAISDITILPYPNTGSSSITTPTLPVGTHSICPSPN